MPGHWSGPGSRRSSLWIASLIYTWLTVAATLVLALAAGWLYTAVAGMAGAWFLAMAYQLYAGVRRGEPVKPLRLFLQSNN
jgi:heme o synthase